MSTSTIPATRREDDLLVALTATAALAFTYAVAVRTALGQALDTRVMVGVSARLANQSWPGTVLGWVTPLSVAVATAALAVVVILHRGPRAAARFLAVAAGTMGAAAGLKALLIRPEIFDGAGNSLPSGHVAAVAGLAVAAFIAAPRVHRSWIAVVGATATAVTGAATLALQWHRPSDVVAAVLVAVAAGALVDAARASAVPQSSGVRGRVQPML